MTTCCRLPRPLTCLDILLPARLQEAEYLNLAKPDASFPPRQFAMLADSTRNEVVVGAELRITDDQSCSFQRATPAVVHGAEVSVRCEHQPTVPDAICGDHETMNNYIMRVPKV